MNTRAWRLAVSAVAVSVGLVSCAPTMPLPPAPPAPPALELSASLMQNRSDVTARIGQLQLTNEGTGPVELGSLAIIDPRFVSPIEPIARETRTLKPGSGVNVRVLLPPVACDTSDAEPRLKFTYGPSDAEASVAVSDPLGFVTAMHTRECDAAALAKIAEVRFGAFEPSSAHEPADLMLEVTPTGSGSATLVALHATPLLMFPAGEMSFPLDLAISSGESTVRLVRIPIVPGRCDPHAVAEDKLGTRFTFDVDLDGESKQVQLFVGEELRGEILRWVSQWCG